MALHDLERPDVKSGSLAPALGGRLADQGCLGPFLEDDQRVAEIDTTLVGQPDQAEERGFDLDPPGDVEQRPAGPERRVEGGEDIVGGRHGLGQQIPANQVGMIPDGLVQVEEDRPAQPAGIGMANGRAVDVLDPGGVVRAQGLPESVQCRTGRTGGRLGARGCEALELEGPDVGSPPLLVAGGRPGEGLEPGEGLATSVDQPGRLVAALEERLEGVFGEAAHTGLGVVTRGLVMVSRTFRTPRAGGLGNSASGLNSRLSWFQLFQVRLLIVQPPVELASSEGQRGT